MPRFGQTTYGGPGAAATGPQKYSATYSGIGASQDVTLPFTPDLVLISPQASTSNITGFAVVHRTDAQSIQAFVVQPGGTSNAISLSLQIGTNKLALTGVAAKDMNQNGLTYSLTAFKFV